MSGDLIMQIFSLMTRCPGPREPLPASVPRSSKGRSFGYFQIELGDWLIGVGSMVMEPTFILSDPKITPKAVSGPHRSWNNSPGGCSKLAATHHHPAPPHHKYAVPLQKPFAELTPKWFDIGTLAHWTSCVKRDPKISLPPHSAR